MGRKSKKNIILNNLKLIKDLKAQGATDVQIARHLGVCPATWYKTLKESKELQTVMNEGKKELEADLVGDLVKLAKGGFTIKTIKTIEKNGEITTEITEKTTSPNLGALIFVLKNISEDWVNEPQIIKLRKEELELKKQQIENNF